MSKVTSGAFARVVLVLLIGTRFLALNLADWLVAPLNQEHTTVPRKMESPLSVTAAAAAAQPAVSKEEANLTNTPTSRRPDATATPTERHTGKPTGSPTATPTGTPTQKLTGSPTRSPTAPTSPSASPTKRSTATPSTKKLEQENSAHKSSCLQLRGQHGMWMPSQKGYKYVTSLQEQAGRQDQLFRKKAKQAGSNKNVSSYLPVTKWQWQDSNDLQECPMQTLTLEGFCGVVKQLKIGRVFFVGDSLTFMMMQSLWKLVGNLDDPGAERNFVKSRIISCPYCEGNQNTTFMLEIDYERNDHLTTGKNATRGCGDICRPWVDRYASNPTKTLLVANTGLHTTNGQLQKQYHQYKSDLDGFVETITNLNRMHDLVVFRTSVPGHNQCGDHPAPYSNYSQFLENQGMPNVPFGWDRVEGFNQYAKDKLSSMVSASNSGHPTWHLLDVYPMTVLRPDGHRWKSSDCLHYSLPGPPDWWNHLLYSNLLDISALGGWQHLLGSEYRKMEE